MDLIGGQVRDWLSTGRRVAVARVLGLEGFSTWTGDPLVAAHEGGRVGEMLGSIGADAIATAFPRATEGPGRLEVISVEVRGSAVAAAGLVCGGRAELLVQPAGDIPTAFWDALVARVPVALVTRIEGPSAGPASLVVDAGGAWSGALELGDPDHLASVAVALFAEGGHGVRRVDDGAGTVLIEAWVPDPRLVVVGEGELVDAIATQAGLLGWEATSAVRAVEVTAGLDWAGASAALVVLSHDAGIDTEALREGLERRVAYVGAMGSRRTQSRRLERLRANGVDEADLDRIHRPIGLDLGGRRPSEVALAIVAEILASRSGRGGGPLRHRQAPIHAPAPDAAGG